MILFHQRHIFAADFPPISGTQDSWRMVLLLRTEAKKGFSISAFSMSCVMRSSGLLSNDGTTFSLVGLLLTMCSWKPLVAFDLTGQIKFHLGFGSAFLLGYLSLLPPSIYFLPVFECGQELLLHSRRLLVLLLISHLVGWNCTWAWTRFNWSLNINQLS